uniref:HI0933 family protein n=1 Tax=Solibacter usitatus (strain Ellin6076) TaxID=234267 RepID=Q01X33_SOLUE
MSIPSADVVIIGAGAAGLMCAIEAGKRGRRVVLVEQNRQIGRKILISGGGRCNFTNLHTTAENFLSRNPHFAKSALARYGPRDFIALVERHRIAYHEKTLGQLFCDGSAAEIVAMLEQECAAAGVRIETDCSVKSIRAAFELETSIGDLSCQALVIATGGLSIPKIGATPFGYEVARQFGINVVECRPALVPLTFGRQDRERFAELSGVSTEVTVQANGAAFREKLLFTHRGLSGPAILQASSYWKPGEPVQIDLLPGIDPAPDFRGSRAEVRTIVGRFLPKRLADRWCEVQGMDRPAPGLAEKEIQAICDGLHGWQVLPAGTEGYEKAEVTAGGVDTAELSSKTLECRKVPGLYFIGEVVDVTGHLGGFNFQWAWASGVAAGQAA